MFPHLLSPVRIGPLQLPNRVVMGSMHTGLEERAGGWERLAAFYAERADVGLIITGGVSPDPAGRAFPKGAMMTAEAVPDHRGVVAAVHAAGGRIALQLLHAGRYAFHGDAVAPSPLAPSLGGRVPRELSDAEVEATAEAFGSAAARAREAGYDGVEVMGSEGYLLTQFLAPRTNHRTDRWGGSAAARLAFPLEVVRHIRARAGADFPIIFRISLLDLVEDGSTWGEALLLARELERAGVHALNSGIGWHEARVPTIAAAVPEGAFTWVTEHLRPQVGIPVIAVNRLPTPEAAEEVLASGQADLVSLARPLLADGRWLSKAAAGRSGAIVPCVACNQACLDRIFELRPVSCMTNPRACRETELSIEPAAQARRFAVVGAGPAGLSAATTLAERGHRVVLFEAGERVGGQLRLAVRIPGKGAFGALLSYYEGALAERGVEVRTHTRAAVADLAGFDGVVVATGTRPRLVDLPGAERALSYVEVLQGAPVGRRVAIIGAGGVGFDVAELLTCGDPAVATDPWAFLDAWGVDLALEHRGGLRPGGPRLAPSPREVWLLQRRRSKVGRDLAPTTGWIHRLRLELRGVHLHRGVRYLRVSDAGLHVEIDGAPRVLPADTVVVCAGQVEDRALSDALEERGMPTWTLGGARDARSLDAERAIREGVELGAVL